VTAIDRLRDEPDTVTALFGDGATAVEAYGLLTVDVPAAAWIAALTTARDELGCTYFDWLSAVDDTAAAGFRVCAHLAALPGASGSPGASGAPGASGVAAGGLRHLLIRTTVPRDKPELPTAIGVFAGAAWHERETHEMFGVGFTGHPHLVPLLLPENFEGHPLRKDFVLAARVAKAWPGAKEPGESEHGGPKRRQMQPPGVPDPNEWGPLKGQLPPAPARPARTPRGAAAGERPARRARSVSEGSATQRPAAGTGSPAAGTEAPATKPTEATAPTEPRTPRRPRTPDAPWQVERPASAEQPAAPESPAAPEAAEQPERAEPEGGQEGGER
jgi:NADH:ubiquinone oxidoreductase subunit C